MIYHFHQWLLRKPGLSIRVATIPLLISVRLGIRFRHSVFLVNGIFILFANCQLLLRLFQNVKFHNILERGDINWIKKFLKVTIRLPSKFTLRQRHHTRLFVYTRKSAHASCYRSANKLLQIWPQAVDKLCSHCLFSVVVTRLEQAVSPEYITPIQKKF